jgi:DNA repair exonuclease SbcCD ATPase subunit
MFINKLYRKNGSIDVGKVGLFFGQIEQALDLKVSTWSIDFSFNGVDFKYNNLTRNLSYRYFTEEYKFNLNDFYNINYSSRLFLDFVNLIDDPSLQAFLGIDAKLKKEIDPDSEEENLLKLKNKQGYYEQLKNANFSAKASKDNLSQEIKTLESQLKKLQAQSEELGLKIDHEKESKNLKQRTEDLQKQINALAKEADKIKPFVQELDTLSKELETEKLKFFEGKNTKDLEIESKNISNQINATKAQIDKNTQEIEKNQKEIAEFDELVKKFGSADSLKTSHNKFLKAMDKSKENLNRAEDNFKIYSNNGMATVLLIGGASLAIVGFGLLVVLSGNVLFLGLSIVLIAGGAGTAFFGFRKNQQFNRYSNELEVARAKFESNQKAYEKFLKDSGFESQDILNETLKKIESGGDIKNRMLKDASEKMQTTNQKLKEMMEVQLKQAKDMTGEQFKDIDEFSERLARFIEIKKKFTELDAQINSTVINSGNYKEKLKELEDKKPELKDLQSLIEKSRDWKFTKEEVEAFKTQKGKLDKESGRVKENLNTKKQKLEDLNNYDFALVKRSEEKLKARVANSSNRVEGCALAARALLKTSHRQNKQVFGKFIEVFGKDLLKQALVDFTAQKDTCFSGMMKLAFFEFLNKPAILRINSFEGVKELLSNIDKLKNQIILTSENVNFLEKVSPLFKVTVTDLNKFSVAGSGFKAQKSPLQLQGTK